MVDNRELHITTLKIRTKRDGSITDDDIRERELQFEHATQQLVFKDIDGTLCRIGQIDDTSTMPSAVLSASRVIAALNTKADVGHDHPQYCKVDGTVAFTGTIAGVMPVMDNHLTTKAYVDNKLSGLVWKTSVVAATVRSESFTTAFANGMTIDDVVLHTGDRILIKDQTDATQNGIYIVNSGGAPTRSSDAATGADLTNAAMLVVNGAINSDTAWVCSTMSPVIGETPIIFAQFSGSGGYFAGRGLTLMANEFVIDTMFTVDTDTEQTLSNKTMLSPALVGLPTAPTATIDDVSTQIATTAYVMGHLSNSLPLKNSGTASIGTSIRFARADHVHPTDATDAATPGTIVKRDALGNFAANTITANVVGNLLGNASTVTNGVYLDAVQVLTNKTLVVPVITNFSNAAHTHFNAADGGVIEHRALSGRDADDHPQYIRVDGTRAFTGPIAGMTPVTAAHLTTKSYVDGLISGLSWKSGVRVATTETGAMAIAFAAGQVVDGVVLSLSDRILIKDQDDARENGIYVVTNGLPVRATDSNTSAGITSAAVFVSNGVRNTNTAWVCISTKPVINMDNIRFVQFSGSGSYTSGYGLVLTGNAFTIDTTVAADLSSLQTLTRKTLASPTMIGIPTAPTATVNTNNTQVATTEFVIRQAASTDIGDYPLADTSLGALGASTKFARADHRHPTSATSASTPGAIVQRDASGNFSANVITATVIGDVTGNAATVTDGVYTTGAQTVADKTLTSATLVRPTVSDFTNAQHAHVDAASGGQIVHANLLGRNADDHQLYIRVDGARAFSSPVSGITPTSSQHLTTKAYVDNLIAGLTWKRSVKAATTQHMSLTTAFAAGQTLDGVLLSVNDRILVKDQDEAHLYENGIYIVNESGAPTRATDANTQALLNSAAVFVMMGTVNADTAWVCSSAVNTLGVDPVVFDQFSGSGTYVSGYGLRLDANEFAIDTGTTVDISSEQTVQNKVLASPTLTGSPVAPTPDPITVAGVMGDGRVATTGFVVRQGSDAVPLPDASVGDAGVLPTFARADHVHPTDATSAVLAGTTVKRDANGRFEAATPAVDDASTLVATTAFVIGQAANTPPLEDGTAAIGTSTRFARADHRHPTYATSENVAGEIVRRDMSGNFSANVITANAPTQPVDTEGEFIATTGFVLQQAAVSAPFEDSSIAAVGTSKRYARADHVHPTTATSANTPDKIVRRDASGNFSAGTVTATLVGDVIGNARTVTDGVYLDAEQVVTNKTLVSPTIADFTNATHTHTSAATGGTVAHSALTGITANDHHAQVHTLDGADHVVTNLVAGQFLKATSATSFAFAPHGLIYTDVGAAPSEHTHPSVDIADATALNTASTIVVRDVDGRAQVTTPAVDDASNLIATTSFVIGQASTIAPLMDGVAAAGSSTRFARADHVHPVDTSRAPVDHASITTAYGAASTTEYGHVKIGTTAGTVATGDHTHTSIGITDATDLATPNTIVRRDSDGNFSAGVITAELDGNAATVTNGVYLTATQTLTNKTLTTPTIGDFTNAAHSHTSASTGGTVAHSALTGRTANDHHNQVHSFYGSDHAVGELTAGQFLKATGASTFAFAPHGLIYSDVGAAPVEHTHVSAEISDATTTATANVVVVRDAAGRAQVTTPAVDDASNLIATTNYVLGQASNAPPVMDGIAAAGSSKRFARADHVHPIDESRAPVDHAVPEPIYGVGSETEYGHVKIGTTAGTVATGDHTHTSDGVTDATSANIVHTIVRRDLDGNFDAGTITADLIGDVTGNADTVTNGVYLTAVQTLTNKTLTTPTIGDFTNAQHIHANEATGGKIAHASLSGVTANDHHSQVHTLDSADHVVSGLTSGQFLKATGATTFAFAPHGLTYSDVGASPIGHTHATSEITDATNLNVVGTVVKRDLNGRFEAETPAVDDATDLVATTAFVIGQAATVPPVMDGVAAAGTSTRFARADHVHPVDTSRAPVSHASSDTTYGAASTTQYGHVKLGTTAGTVSEGNHTHTSAGITDATADATPDTVVKRDAAGDFRAGTITADLIGDVTGNADTVTNGVYLTAVQTLTNKTLTTPTIANFTYAQHSHANLAGGGTISHSALTDLTDDDHLQYARVDGTRAFTGAIFGVTPVLDNHLATKAYVDNLLAGLSWKSGVRVATTVGGTLSGFIAGVVVDGVELVAGDRILLKNQADATENGIYVVATVDAPERSEDADDGSEIVGASVFVKEGTVNANTAWVCTNVTIEIDVDPIEFVQFSGSGTYSAGNGIILESNEFSINTAVVTDLNGVQTLTNKTIASPTLTGVPTTPTAVADTTTTQVASTAFVIGQAASTNPVMAGTVSVGTSKRYARADHRHPIDTSRAPVSHASSDTTYGAASTTQYGHVKIGTTAGTVAEGNHTHTSAGITDATDANAANTIVKRDADGDFSAGTVTADLIGNVTGDVSGNAGTVTNGVYLTATQTLTNKTLTTPTIANFTNATHTHTSASTGGTIAHNALTGQTANDHHNQVHTLLGGDHTVSGLTGGQFLKAMSATTFGFASHGLTYTDVGAAPVSHTHATGEITDATSLNVAATLVKRDADGRFEAETPVVDDASNLVATTAFVIGQAANTPPLVNGTAATGTSTRFARADHVHGTDATRAPVNHASSATTYGAASTTQYGHVKIGTTAGTVSEGNHTHVSAGVTDATAANTANMIVKRDVDGNFIAGTITANLIGNVTGNADTVTNGVYLTAIQTLTNKTLTTPTIADFTNAVHNHTGTTSGGTIAHSALTGRTANDHHNQVHTLLGSDHTVAGLTAGQFLKATSATTVGFGPHGLTYTDVGAAPASHTHADVTSATSENTPSTIVKRDVDGRFEAETPAVDDASELVATTAFVIGQASNVLPLVNGTAAIGISTRFARADHVHSTDSSRAPTSHASTGTTYGAASTTHYGHVKIGTTAGTVAEGNHTHLSAGITDATDENTANTIVKRDVDGNFAAGTITATLNGNAATVTNGVYLTATQTLTNKTLTTPTIGDFTNAAHSHTSASTGGTIAHSALTGRTANDHHNQVHTLLGTDHTVSGLTAGQFLKATGTSTVAFGPHGLTYTDVGAAPTSHTHATAQISDATNLNVAETVVKRDIDGRFEAETPVVDDASNLVATTAFVIGQAANVAPLADTATAVTGVSTRFARADHVHPTSATNANTANAIVKRDASGNFSAGTITASLNGNAATVTNGVYLNAVQTLTNKTLTTPVIADYSSAQHAHSSAATGGTIAHSTLTGISANDHHDEVHVLTGSAHAASGLTVGQFLKATSATTFAFASHGLTYTDVGAAPASHNHDASAVTAGVLAVARGGTGIGSYTAGNYLYASAAGTLAQRTPVQVLSDINAAPKVHNLIDTTNHPVSGLTSGQFLKALTATTYGFAAHGLTYSDVGAAPTSHAHASSDISDATNANVANKIVIRDADGRFEATTPAVDDASNLVATTSFVIGQAASTAPLADAATAVVGTSKRYARADHVHPTSATNANTANAIVKRDASGNFSAGTITAALNGNAATVTNGVYLTATQTLTNKTLTTPTIGDFTHATHTHASAATGGTIDHGSLTGRGDDDHTIYVKADGTRAFSGVVSGVTPTASTHLVTKAYVDSLITGMTWKVAVRAATTANGALTTAFANGQVIDGVTLVTGDRILLKNQATAAENGIYTVNATGAPTRAADANSAEELVGSAVFVREGTANADTAWVCTNDTISLEATQIVYVQFSGNGTYVAGTGLRLTGNAFAIDTATTVDLSTSQTLTNKILSSPALTGTPTAPTAPVDTSNTQIATTGFVSSRASALEYVPAMNGAALGGISNRFAREDHVHPIDTSRAPVSHAVSSTIYGTASSTNYGHVKCSSTTAAPAVHTHAHGDLTDCGTNTHATIDVHLGDATKHRVIDDASTTTTALWSASKISTELGGKAAATHSHTSAQISDATNANTPSTVVKRDANGAFNVATAAADTNTTQVASTAFVLGQAATATPLVNGTAAVGTSTRFARGDHVHGTDTSRAPTNHASTATTYGTASSTNYGHVKCSSTTAAPAVHTHVSADVTDATHVNTASMIVKRDASGDFSAGTITATLNGNAATVTNGVYTSRTISTTAPLTGGGDLSANRTIGISAATTSAAGSMSAADKTKLDAATNANTASTLVIRDTNGRAQVSTPAVDDASNLIATTNYVIGQASSTTPTMNGTATIGTSTRFARADHIHPVDTSRAPTSHASSATTYGVASSSNYGHVKCATTTAVPTNRTISTTAPLTGGGDLSANRTLAISAATTSAAGSMSAADKTKLDAATSAATSSTVMMRDASGNVAANVITVNQMNLTASAAVTYNAATRSIDFNFA